MREMDGGPGANRLDHWPDATQKMSILFCLAALCGGSPLDLSGYFQNEGKTFF